MRLWEMENRDRSVNLDLFQSARSESPTGDARVGVVKMGKNRSRIMSRAHGSYAMVILRGVLSENSQIQNPHQMMAGLVIKLPERK